MRELAVPGAASLSLDDIRSGLDLSDGDLNALHEHLQEPCALLQGHAHPWLARVAAELHDHTWMRVADGVSDVVHTKRGTRPGSSWADLTFAILLRRVLKTRDQARGFDTTPCVGWDGSRNPFRSGPSVSPQLVSDIIFADDLCSCHCLSRPSNAKAELAHATGILTDSFQSHGMRLAYGATKTAALVSLRGPGARAAHSDLFRVPEIAVLREHEGPVTLPVVARYRHVGVIHQFDGSIKPELRQRCGEAWAAFQEGRRKVYRNTAVSLGRRITLLRSLVLSRLLFGAGACPKLRVGEAKQFQAIVLSFYRQTLVLPRDSCPHLWLCSLCALASKPPPETLLFAERLRYLRQLVANGPDPLWALVKQDAPYLEAVQEALAWLYRRVQCTCKLPNPASDWEPWALIMGRSPGRFRGFIKKAACLDTLRCKCLHLLSELHSTLCQLGGTSLLPPERGDLQECTELCIPCRIAFPTRVAWACHAARKHGYRAAGGQIAEGCTCRACGTRYANERRLKRHLCRSAACRRHWGCFVPAEVDGPRHEQCPPEAVEGLFLPPTAGDEEAGVCSPLLATLRLVDEAESEGLLQLCAEFIAPIEVIRYTLAAWSDELPALSRRAEAAANVLALLHPGSFADTCKFPKIGQPPLLPHLPKWRSLQVLPKVLTGDIVSLSIPDPPSPSFPFPFAGTACLQAANATTEWLATATGTLQAAARRCAEAPVRVHLSLGASRVLGVVDGWFFEAGFSRRGEVLGSCNRCFTV